MTTDAEDTAARMETEFANLTLTDQDRRNAQVAAHLDAQELLDLKAIMGTAEGRRMFWRLLSNAGIYHSPFSPDIAYMARAVGRQDWGREIFLKLNIACPELYARMTQENGKDMSA